jgi:hypothetical protein
LMGAAIIWAIAQSKKPVPELADAVPTPAIASD